MRVMFHANAPWIGSGYGQAARWAAHELQKLGHDVAIASYYGLQGTVLDWRGIRVYPGPQHGFGLDTAVPYAKDFDADVLVSVVDAFVLGPLVEHARAEKLPLVLWSPIDQAPVPPRILKVAEQADLFACYSAWGTDALRESGIERAQHAPIGIDTSLFAPMPQHEARQRLGFDPDAYLVGMVASNLCPHSRKAWAQQLEGFALFRKSCPKAVLYCHTNPLPETGTGWNLHEMVVQFGIEDAVLFPDQRRLRIGISPESMRMLYNAFDVLLSASAGEGFCLPIVEAQACETPVICGGWTSMPEIFSGYGWMLDPKNAMRWRAPQGGFWFYPEPHAVAEALSAVHEGTPAKRARARLFVLDHYDAERVTKDRLLPALESVL